MRTPSGPARWIPAWSWLGTYQAGWLGGDFVAGLTLAAYLIPAALGDASLAGLPPQSGLYACLFSGAVFWLFCSSRHTAITTTSAISLLIGASLAEIAHGDTSRFATLAAATAVIVALIAFAAWCAHAGAIVSFIPESVMVGFKCGVALVLASTQLPKLFGFHGAHGDFWVNSAYFVEHLHETHPASLAIGLATTVVLVLGKLFLARKPVALFVVAAGIVATTLFSLEARGVQVIGAVPRGVPAPGLPAMRLADLNELLALGFACFLLAAVETAAIGRMFVAKHGGRLDANQEFLAIAVSNLAAGLGRGLAVSGGTSQSVVNEGAGARTPLSTAISTGFILVVVLFLSPLIRELPQPVLAAIVLVAVTGLFQVSALRHLWRASRPEFVVAITAFVGVLGFGLLRGVLIGSVISLLQLLRHVSRPHVAELGRIPGTRRFSDLERHPDNIPVPGALIFRPEANLVYFNIDGVCERIEDRVRTADVPPGLVVLDLSGSPSVDLQGAETLGRLARELGSRGVRVQVVETHSTVRDLLRGEGLDQALGGINRFTSVADAVERFANRDAAS